MIMLLIHYVFFTEQETEIHNVNLENQKLSHQYQIKLREIDQIEINQIHQKDIYLNDKNCMALFLT